MKTNRPGKSDDKNCPSSAAGLSLGIIAEFSSASLNSEFSALQHQELKSRFRMLSTARRLLPDERIAACMYEPAPEATHVIGRYNPQTKSSRYVCLKHCDSSSCPHCALQRSYEDRLELSAAMASAQEQGLHPVFITFTLSHHQGDDLEGLRAALGKAYDAVFSGRWYQKLKKEYGIVGKLKSWETPYGRNGWHPHLHPLFFMEMELTEFWIGELEYKLSERWIAALEKLGYSASWKHGVRVETATSRIAEYISKFGREPINPTWGAESEIALSPMKKAHESGLTPLQLLNAASGDKDCLDALMLRTGMSNSTEAQKRAESLYVEYFKAFKGRSRIHWSKGLKELLGVQERVNLIRMENPSPFDDEYDMVWIDRGADGWNKVRYQELRAELLAVIRTGDTWLVSDFLRDNGISGRVTAGAWERAADNVTLDSDAQPSHAAKKAPAPPSSTRIDPERQAESVTELEAPHVTKPITCNETVTDNALAAGYSSSAPGALAPGGKVYQVTKSDTLEPGYPPGEQLSLFDQEHRFSEAYLQSYGESDNGRDENLPHQLGRGNDLQARRGYVRSSSQSG